MLIFCRGAAFAAVLSAFGCVVFRLAVAAPNLPVGRVDDRLTAMLRLSLAVGLVLTVLWVGLQAAAISGAETWAEFGDALPYVALQTWFGKVVLVRTALLAAALAIAKGRSRDRIALPIVAAAVLTQALIGHAMAMGGPAGDRLMVSETLHVLAAGAWLGGLAPLLLSLTASSSSMGARLSHGFTPIGLAAVLLLAGTGLLQGAALVGGWTELAGTSYGRVALVKLALFAVLLGLALANRFVLTARLGELPAARSLLCASVAVETALGVMVIMAAASLASLPPGIDHLG